MNFPLLHTSLSQHRWVKIVLVILLVSGLVWLYFFDPQKALTTPPCIWHMITGIDCPGCGTARAVHQLLHGDILQAMDQNLLFVFLLPYLLITGFQTLSGVYFRWTQKLYKASFIFWLSLSFWILRNIPLYPFSYLHSGT